MYICICNAIRENELRRVARSQPGDAEELYRALGKTPCCRQCLDEADELVEDARTAIAA